MFYQLILLTMKKKMIGFLVVAGIAVVVAVNVNLGMQRNTLPSVALENVEALAYELPEVVIDCSGRNCRMCTGTICMSGEYTCLRGVFTGYIADYCWCPC
jgi:hypothetical protein